MTRSLRIALVLVAAAVLAQQAVAQDSKAAKFTREKLKQVIAEFDSKETGTKAFFEDVNRELETQLRFKIDVSAGKRILRCGGGSGISHRCTTPEYSAFGVRPQRAGRI